ncbi:MAG: BlaI/MecI/CopY family transcriptional regulator [Pirellulaceae bacterium]|nr:BlaI/MecI/CopY family transcriptional regulator [Pirellulaceae bacterium]
MVRPKSAYPTELELQILKILWQQSPLAVREVRDALAKGGRDLAHTSVITTLNVMVRKKYLRRRRDGNAYLFEPRIAKEDVSRQVLGDLLDRVFDGSAKAVVMGLFDCDALDSSDLKELRLLIDQKAKEQNNERK